MRAEGSDESRTKTIVYSIRARKKDILEMFSDYDLLDLVIFMFLI